MRDYSILDDLSEGVQIIDSDLRYVYLNKSLLREVRKTPEEIFGVAMTEAFPGFEKTEIFGKICECLNDGETKELLNEFKFPDGRHSFYEVKMQAVEEGVILFTRDITTTKKGELLLRETNKDLEHFAHIAAHDMREPVRRISILSEELLLDHELTPDVKAVCENIDGQAQALMQLINDFRSLSGISVQELSREVFSVVDLAQDTAEQFTNDLEMRKMTIHWPSVNPLISAHPSLVRVLFRNLFENALKHGNDHIRFSILEGATQIFVLSNLTTRTSPSKDLFLPFVTGDRKNGTGLGLAICKKVVTKHQGSIWSEQTGDTFKLSFTLDSA
jgi:signal transduction histidine kinase